MGTALGPGPHRIAAVGHGTVFFLLTVAGLGVLLLILALTLPGPGLVAYGLGQHHHAGGIALAPALPALGVSVFLICSLLLVMRRLASLTRRLVGQWCGVPIADPYLPQPWADGGKAGLRRRLGWLLTDRATWRDLLWVTVKQLYARELLASGSGGIGYLLKDRVFDSAQFVDAVRRVAAGGTAMDPEVIARLLARNTGDGSLATLSPREREVLALMAEGRSNAAIAQRMVITERAVAKHTASIFLKLDLQPSDDDNRRVLAVLAYLGG